MLFSDFDEEVVVYDCASSTMYLLDAFTAAILGLITKDSSRDEILQRIQSDLGVPVDSLPEEQIDLVLKRLLDMDLITCSSQ